MAGERLIETYPLTWPILQPRCVSRASGSQFKTTLYQASEELRFELKALGASHFVVSSNLQLRRDGLPFADAREPDDPGVAVYFDRLVGKDERPFVIACDQYLRARHNVRAIGLTVVALRSIARHGASSMMEQAFTGFAALPPAGRDEPWWDVLGVTADASPDVIKAAFRELVRVHHPDAGGSHEVMAKLNAAFQAAYQRQAPNIRST